MDHVDNVNNGDWTHVFEIFLHGHYLDGRENFMILLDLAQQAGLNPKWAAGTGGGEYHSPCPVCGGKDRFFMQPSRQMRNCRGSYRCRQCGIYGDTIKFAQMILKYPFKEAVEIVGASLPDNQYHSIFRKKIAFITRPMPPALWLKNASNLVEISHRHLLDQSPLLADLGLRGVSLEVIKKHKLGWIKESKFYARDSWGLDANEAHSQLWMPKGLLIPSIENDSSVVRLKVRRCDIAAGDKLPRYVMISGSMGGMIILGSIHNKIAVVVESELDAYALRHLVAQTVSIICVGGSSKNPDRLTDELARKANTLLICRDNDVAGEKMFTKWRALYPHAKDAPTPVGKDIGEAIEQGLNIKEWLLNI